MFQSMHRCLAIVLFFALSMSCTPMAFASEDNPSVQPDSPALATEVPIINVTVPTSFILGGDAGIDIQELGDVSASSQFVSSSNVSVRIKEIRCDASGLNSYFDVKDTNKATFSLLGKNVEWAPTAATDTAIYESSTEGSEEFILPVDAAEDATLSLTMSGMGLKDAAIEATKDRRQLRDLMQLSWTFGVVGQSSGGSEEPDPGPEPDKDGDGNLEDDFYLQVNEGATHADLVGHKGAIYSLSNLRTMAEDLSDKGESSEWYKMFKAMTGDASEQYACRVKWEDGSYDVRVIGVLHDQYKTNDGRYRKAGLTFQFKNLLNSLHSYLDLSVSSDLAQNWMNSAIRANMNPGKDFSIIGHDVDVIWGRVPYQQKEAFKSVIKPNSDGKSTFTTEDKLFLASWVELGGTMPLIDDAMALGCGYFRDEGTQYDYYANHGTDQNVLNKPLQNGSVMNQAWYLRTCIIGRDNAMLGASNANIPADRDNLRAAQSLDTRLGICPCFCL